ncbi:MAG TPA: metallophosphoesterase [Polyangia bacterium]|jgi:predicted phosphodiesterase|nr:metallophosphoesterase [Polyangia bacterium]
MRIALRLGLVVVASSLLACSRANPDGAHADAGSGTGVGGNGSSADLAVGATGGVGGALLSFAVFGDCRPPLPEDTTQYPTMIVTSIFTRAEDAGVQFVIGTGDYMNAFTQTAVDAQVDLFLGARAAFKGPVYLTMGNHECMTTTTGNCPNANESPNAQVYMAKLAPAGSTKPYFRIDLPTPFGAAKLVFVAANAWSTEQNDWLKLQLADATRYTFVMRHEASNDQSAPGVGPSDALMMGAPLTVGFFGHTHVYQRVDPSHVIAGNGGAPLDSGTQYGLVLVTQRADGNVALTAIDQATGNAIDAWSVTPDGQLTP